MNQHILHFSVTDCWDECSDIKSILWHACSYSSHYTLLSAVFHQLHNVTNEEQALTINPVAMDNIGA